MGLFWPGVATAGVGGPFAPEKVDFLLRSAHSEMHIELFTGGDTGPMSGLVRLYLGDPGVPVPDDIPGLVGVSVRKADLIGQLSTPTIPRHLILDPNQPSTGRYNYLTQQIAFDLYLTTEQGPLPVPMPVHLAGRLNGEYLHMRGDNGNVADGLVRLVIGAVRRDLLFSTEIGFTPGNPPHVNTPVSDGDLLSAAGWIVRTNFELTQNLGIKPVWGPLGLDAAFMTDDCEVWFSTEVNEFSETLGPLRHGDLLSEVGAIVRRNIDLIAPFQPMPPIPDLGLDAVHVFPNGLILFSTEEGFFSESQNLFVSDGDLLTATGVIALRNAQLLAQFNPIGPIAQDYGLDAVFFAPPRANTTANREIWFSVEDGFLDQAHGVITDGDLLSNRGEVVVRNLDLVEEFAPLEDVNNFGLDALHVRAVVPGDITSDKHIDLVDFATFATCYSGPNATQPPDGCPALEFVASDTDADGDVDLQDYATFAANYTG